LYELKTNINKISGQKKELAKNDQVTTTSNDWIAFTNVSAPPAKMRIPVYVTIREKYGIDILVCPKCKEHHLELVATHYRTGGTPPGTIMASKKPSNQFRNKASPTEF
jgi:hypothetical protein